MTEKLDAELLYEITCDLGEVQNIGKTQYGTRGIIPVTGGHFEGPKLRGRILPNCAGEWGMTRPDGVGRLDVRMTLATDDGALIYLSYNGVLAGEPEAMARAMRGEAESDEVYFRTTPNFETGDERYLWLNRVVAIGYGRMLPGFKVQYRVYHML